MIKIEGLNLEFPQRFRLCIDKLCVQKGSILAILGPNGAGKSTLLNILALFQKPDSGSIRVCGENIFTLRNKSRFRRKISFVFPQAYLLDETVYENVFLPLRLRGLHNTKKVDETLELFSITSLKDCRASTLSQGQRHRVSLARAFVTDPELLLLDEPFLSLDQRYKESLNGELRQILKENKTTALLVTQDQIEALSLADTLAIMKDGRILQQGKPQDVFVRPVSKEVADFVGVETILSGEIIEKEDNLCFIKVADKILQAVSPYCERDEVFICIRPEDVIISRQQETSSARNHFTAKITHVEPWGLEYKLGVDCGFPLVASVTRHSIDSLGLKIGADIFVSFKATAIHLIKR